MLLAILNRNNIARLATLIKTIIESQVTSVNVRIHIIVGGTRETKDHEK
jgi:hypothetical protein